MWRSDARFPAGNIAAFDVQPKRARVMRSRRVVPAYGVAAEIQAQTQDVALNRKTLHAAQMDYFMTSADPSLLQDVVNVIPDRLFRKMQM